jgi:hypothetical protein
MNKSVFVKNAKGIVSALPDWLAKEKLASESDWQLASKEEIEAEKIPKRKHYAGKFKKISLNITDRTNPNSPDYHDYVKKKERSKITEFFRKIKNAFKNS